MLFLRYSLVMCNFYSIFFLLILLSDTKHNKYNFIPGTRQIKFNVCCANCSRLAKIDAILTHRERTN